MQTQQLQQNMKEKVKVFEDGGIRLLKKGQKGLVHAIFSRFGLVLVLLLLQFGALFSLLRWFGQLLPHYLGGTALVTAAMVVYLLNIDMDNSVRITWLVVIAVLPVLGVPLFWYTKADIGHNALKKRLMDLESQTRAQLPQPEGVEQRLEADSPGAASLARYLRGRGGGFPVQYRCDLLQRRRGQVCRAAAPVGNGGALHLSGILHHRRRAHVGPHPGGAGPQSGRRCGCAGDVRWYL